MNIEYIIYDYLKSEIKRVKKNVSFDIPISEDVIITLVGLFGLDILKDTKLIEPTAYPGRYMLSCESEACV